MTGKRTFHSPSADPTKGNGKAHNMETPFQQPPEPWQPCTCASGEALRKAHHELTVMLGDKVVDFNRVLHLLEGAL